MAKYEVAVVFGSDSDWPVMKKCVAQLQTFDVEPMVEVMSAHRNPARVAEFAEGASRAGFKVIIAGAGMSAALAGTLAAHTALPVIGVPLAGGSLKGIDALLATVQMPPGVPVGSVGIGDAGAKNAAFLAIRILALSDERLASAYDQFKARLADGVAEKNAAIQAERAG